jgi:isopentenyl-diphosphate delta-isomerase
MPNDLSSHDHKDSPATMSRRKDEHITLCCRDDIEAGNPGFDAVELAATALPELNLSDVDTSAIFLGRSFATPLMIAAMTGGVCQAERINELLAAAAVDANIPMGLGSQKIMLKDPHQGLGFLVRKRHPNLFLIGNLSATEFHHGATLDAIERVVETLELNAFAFHLNALQECIQPEGQRQFRDVLAFFEQAAKRLPIPIVAKEVGAGISGSDFARLAQTGVAAIDVGGSGGTSWARVEALRATGLQQRLGMLFADWGIPTARAIAECAEVRRKSGKKRGPAIIATGGVRSGIDVAKAVALGASACGVARPLLKALLQPPDGMSAEESVRGEIRFFVEGLRTAMFLVGAKTISDITLKSPVGGARK